MGGTVACERGERLIEHFQLLDSVFGFLGVEVWWRVRPWGTRPLSAPLSHKTVMEVVWAQSGSTFTTFRADGGLVEMGSWNSECARNSR